GGQDVGVQDFQARLAGEPGAQVIHQGGVDLDRHHAGGAAQELLGERAAAGSDFDYQVFARGANGDGNTLQDVRVGEEVLAEFWRQSVAASSAGGGRR